MSRLSVWSIAASCGALLIIGSSTQAYADNMSALIAQKSVQPQLSTTYTASQSIAPAARISTRSSIQRANSNSSIDNRSFNSDYSYNYQPVPLQSATTTTSYPYPATSYNQPVSSALPAFLSGSYDNVDSQYLPLLSQAESQSNPAARNVISTARAMTLNERTIIQGGCWDYLNAVFKRAGVSRDTVHKGVYRQGPYANTSDIEVGDWLYYINHGYRGIEHSGLFVGWVDESAKQALILSYAGESRREPARYKVYDLSNVYQIMRPTL